MKIKPLRGSSWNLYSLSACAAFRIWFGDIDRSNFIGFRLTRVRKK